MFRNKYIEEFKNESVWQRVSNYKKKVLSSQLFTLIEIETISELLPLH